MICLRFSMKDWRARNDMIPVYFQTNQKKKKKVHEKTERKVLEGRFMHASTPFPCNARSYHHPSHFIVFYFILFFSFASTYTHLT